MMLQLLCAIIASDQRGSPSICFTYACQFASLSVMLSMTPPFIRRRPTDSPLGLSMRISFKFPSDLTVWPGLRIIGVKKHLVFTTETYKHCLNLIASVLFHLIYLLKTNLRFIFSNGATGLEGERVISTNQILDSTALCCPLIIFFE